MSESKLPLKFARWQRQRLPRQPSRARDARVHRRTWAILDGDRGESASHIARGPEVTRQSGHNRTAADAEAAEPESRVDDARPGRPAPWAEDVRAAFRALPEQTPDRLGYFAVNNGTRLFLERGHRRAEDVQAFLRLLHRRCRGWRVTLRSDEGPSRTAAGSVRLAASFDSELWWLPERCPALSPMGRPWGGGKEVISAKERYAAVADQARRSLTCLQAFPGEAALQTAGVLSKDFWLRRVLSNYFCGLA
jgi:hypothetical protein